MQCNQVQFSVYAKSHRSKQLWLRFALWLLGVMAYAGATQEWSVAQEAPKAQADPRGDFIRANYTKSEVKIRMRDGVELFTSIYTPNDPDPSKKYPILLMRTPYSVGPYGLSAYKTRLGPSPEFEKNHYIFVFQDVRGRYMSGGEFLNMRPQQSQQAQSSNGKADPSKIDESTDTYDTIEIGRAHV